jgi:hypothetical protein
MIGTQVANYKILEQVGEGGMGVVYKGVDVTLDRLVAIKVLSTELVGNPQLVERFRAEAKAQAGLNHTNIATLYSFLQIDGKCIIVMEYLEGESFDQMIRRRGVIPAEEAVPYFRQALLGIGFAHRAGIIHRDIKPGNIMVTRGGIVKVMDFGIAKVLGGQRLTRTGTRMGTVAYMSPEQIRNLPVDIRSDIYSLGATLYEMLTAHLPFESDSDFQVMSDHVNAMPPPPTQHYPYIAPGYEQCVMKALAKNPAERFQTVEEFGAGLEHPQGLPGYAPGNPIYAPGGQPVTWGPGAPGQGGPPRSTPPRTPSPAWGQPGGTPPPGGQWTPPGGTHPGMRGGTPPLGQQSMSGATWVDGPPGALPGMAPGGMAGATQMSMPPMGQGAAKPSFWTQKNILIVAGGAVLLLVLIVAMAAAIAHHNQTQITAGGGGGGGAAVTRYSTGGGGGNAPYYAPAPPAGGSGSGGTIGGGSTGGGTPPAGGGGGIGGGVFTPPPAAPAGGTPHGPSGPGHAAPPAAPPGKKGVGAQPATPTPPPPAPAPAAGGGSQPAQPAATPAANAAQTARSEMSQNRILEPHNDCALYWAIIARQGGSPDGAAIENQIINFEVGQIKLLYSQRNLEGAGSIVNDMLAFYPGNPQLLQDKATIEQASGGGAPGAGRRFLVNHRHVNLLRGGQEAYCQGTLTIGSDGTVSYYCTKTFDPTGRCDRVTFPKGSIKSEKMSGTELHLEVDHQGNWDFFGASNDISAAYQAISPFAAKH